MSIVLAILAVLLTVLALPGLADTVPSIAGTSIPTNEPAISQTEVSNSSATATTIIATTGALSD